MSDFIENVIEKIRKCVVYGSRKPNETESPQNWEEVSSAIYLFDSLGENARRMLEIGIVQDELVKLGFKFNFNEHMRMNNKNGNYGTYYNIYFELDYCCIFGLFDYYYTSPTWQQDILAKVRELIGDKS